MGSWYELLSRFLFGVLGGPCKGRDLGGFFGSHKALLDFTGSPWQGIRIMAWGVHMNLRSLLKTTNSEPCGPSFFSQVLEGGLVSSRSLLGFQTTTFGLGLLALGQEEQRVQLVEFSDFV